MAKKLTKTKSHYILNETIGEGTFGKVKLGTHLATGENVAVKILEKEGIVDVADMERVAREIHILKLIRHPHIVQLYEIIETPAQLYLIMEYANGGELFDYIVANVRVKEREACKFLHQIVSGVDKIHECGVVHRDLKPENLLLDEKNNIKIVDFGLSNTFVKGQLLKTACGSPCYAAPEMIAGQKYVPSLCDVWSCGVILFAIICGFLPFEDQNTANLYNKILNADYQLPKFVSQASRDLIAGMLTTDPSKRLDFNGVRKHSWYLGLIQVQSLAQRPPDLQFLDTVNGCGVPSCIRCHEWFSEGFATFDEDVLQQLEQFNLSKDYALKCLHMNKHNTATTTYYLLLERKTRLMNETNSADEVRERFANFERPPRNLEALLDTGVLSEPNIMEAHQIRVGPAMHPVHGAFPKPHAASPHGPSPHAPPPHAPSPYAPPPHAPSPYAPPPHAPSLDYWSAEPVQHSHQPRQPRQPQSARQPRDVDRALEKLNPTPSPTTRAPSATPRRRTPLQMDFVTPRGPASAVVDRLYGRKNFTPRAPAQPSTQRPQPGIKYDKGSERPTSGQNSNPARRYSVSRPSCSAGAAAPTKLTGIRNIVRRPYGRTMGSPDPRSITVPMRPRGQRTAPQSARGAPTYPIPVPATCLSSREPREVHSVMRSCRGAFNVSCTTTKAPKIVMQEIQRSLNIQRVSFKQNSAFSVKCQKHTIKFEVEVSHLDNLESVYVIRFKRIAGELAQYKELCSHLLGDMRV